MPLTPAQKQRAYRERQKAKEPQARRVNPVMVPASSVTVLDELPRGADWVPVYRGLVRHQLGPQALQVLERVLQGRPGPTGEPPDDSTQLKAVELAYRFSLPTLAAVQVDATVRQDGPSVEAQAFNALTVAERVELMRAHLAQLKRADGLPPGQPTPPASGDGAESGPSSEPGA